VAGKEHRADTKLTTVTVGPEGGRSRLSLGRSSRQMEQAVLACSGVVLYGRQLLEDGLLLGGGVAHENGAKAGHCRRWLARRPVREEWSRAQRA
jgi:hypothetical protein